MVIVGLVAQKCFREPCVGTAAIIVVLIVISIYFSGHSLNERFIGLLARGQMAKRFCCGVHRSVDLVSSQSIVMDRDFDLTAAPERLVARLQRAVRRDQVARTHRTDRARLDVREQYYVP